MEITQRWWNKVVEFTVPNGSLRTGRSTVTAPGTTAKPGQQDQEQPNRQKSLGADGHLGVLQNTVGHKSVEGPVNHGTMPSGFVIVKMPTDAAPPATAVPSETLLAQLRVGKPSQR